MKSFLETKTPQDCGGWNEVEKHSSISGSSLGSGGPQLLLNRLVLSTLSAAARSRPFLYSPPLHQKRAKEPRNSKSRAATQNSLGPSQQQCKLAEAGAVLGSALLTVLTSHYSGSGDGTVEDFTRLDESLLGTLYHRVERESDVLCRTNRNATKNCHCGMVSHYLEPKIVGVDSSIMQLQWTVSRREKVT